MTAIVCSSLQIGDGGIYGSVPEARVGSYCAPTITSDIGVNPTNHYAFGERFIPTLVGAANNAWLVCSEIQPTFDDTAAHTGMEAAAHYVSAYLKPNVHLDFLALCMIDEISRDSGASVTDLYGLYVQPIMNATGKNIAIKTVEGDVPAQHEFGGHLLLKANVSGGSLFEVQDTSSGQGFYHSGGTCLNFDKATNGTSAGVINHVGYAGGITQLRDLYIQNGKADNIAVFKASDLSLSVVGGFGCNGKSPQTAQSSGGTLSGVIAALVANGILAN